MSLRKSESDALALAHGRPELVEAVQRSRQMLRRRAWVAGAAAAVPFPGLDWAMDAAMLTQLLPRINSEFGLTPQQIEQLYAKEKERVQKAIAMIGSVLIGRVVTKTLVLRFARVVGVRLTAAQAAKYVPLAGQLVSGALGYAALRYLGEQHIQDCLRVVQTAQLALPPPAPSKTRAFSPPRLR